MLTVGQMPQTVAAWIGRLRPRPGASCCSLINLFLLLAGIFIEPLPGVMILVPMLAPLALAAGIDPLHFAIVVLVNLTLGMITPPVGGAAVRHVDRLGRDDGPDCRASCCRCSAPRSSSCCC